MSVNGRGTGYREKYLEIILNAGQYVLVFDNYEVVQDVEFGETHYPEKWDSQMGYATKVSARRPLSMKAKFTLEYPRTIGKLNDLLAYTRDRYVMDVRLWGYRDWDAASPIFVVRAYKEFRAILEHPADLSWRFQARGQGINKDTKPEFIFWQTQALTVPLVSNLSGGLNISQDGSPVVIAASNETGVPKTRVTTT